MRAWRAFTSLFVLIVGAPSCGSATSTSSSKTTAPISTTAATSPAAAKEPEKEAYAFVDIEAGCRLKPVVSPDASRLAMCDAESTLAIRNARDGAVLHRLDVPGSLLQMHFQDDGARLVALTDLGAVAWETTTGKVVFSAGARTLGTGHAMFSPSGQWLVAVEHAGTARIIDVTSGEVKTTFTVPAGSQIERIGTKSDRLLTWSGHVAKGQNWVLWEIPSGKKLAEPKDRSAYLSPDMYSAIVSDEEYGMVRLVDAATGSQRWNNKWPAGGWTGAVWSDNGSRVALVSDAPGATEKSLQAQLSVLDVATQKLTTHEFRVTVKELPQWGRGSEVLLVGKPTRSIMDPVEQVALDARTGKPLARRPAPGVYPGTIADQAGNVAVELYPNEAVLDGKTGAKLWTIEPVKWTPLPQVSAVVSPFGALVAIRGRDATTEKTMRVFRLDRGEQWAISEPSEFPPKDVLLAGSTVVGLGSVSNDEMKYGGVKVWLLEQGGKVTKTIQIGDERPSEKKLLTSARQAILSRDGKYLALMNEAKVELWDTTTGKMLVEVPAAQSKWASGGPYAPRRIEFAPSGETLWIEQDDVLRAVRVPSGEVTLTKEIRGTDWWIRQDGALMAVERYRKETLIDFGERTVTVDASTGKTLSSVECGLRPFSSDPKYVSPSGAFLSKFYDLWEIATCSNKKLPPNTEVGGFSGDGKYALARVGAGKDGQSTLAISLSTFAIERGVLMPSQWRGVNSSGDFVVFETKLGVAFWNPATGATYRMSIPTSTGAVTWADGGRFEATDDVAKHVRIFVPGAKDGRIVLKPGAEQDSFRRKNLHQEFFGKR